jgi:hypothetical protein
MKINEITRVERYYQQNPDRLARYDLTSPKSADNNRFMSGGDHSRVRDEKTAFENKWKEVLGPALYKKVFSWGSDLSYGFERATERANGDFEKFIDIFGQSVDLDDQEVKQLAQLHSAIIKSYTALQKKIQGLERADWSRFQKNATKAGISASDYQAVQNWIEHFTSMSRKTIPPEIWPALQKLTVIPSKLPKTVYRGLFFDGAKIKDREKWMQKWAVGSKPNVKPTKIQSWSTSKGVASQFMDAQDFVKDKENGFAIMLKYDITDPNVVIADFRNLKDSGFWNQQEIVLSPDARDYEVVAALPYEDYYKLGKDWTETDLYNYQKQNRAPGAGASGMEYNRMFINYFFDINQLQIDPADKENMKQATKLTVGKAKEKLKFPGTFFDNIEQSFENTLMPLYALSHPANSDLSGNWKIVVDKATGRNSMDSYIKTGGTGRSANVINQLFGNIKGLEYGEAFYLPVRITLDNNDYNSIEFNVTPTGDFFVGERHRFKDEMEVSNSKGGSKINDLIKRNPDVSQKLLDSVREALSQYEYKNVKLNLTV